MFDYPQHMVPQEPNKKNKKNDEFERELADAVGKAIGLLIAFVIGLIVCALIGCTPKITEQHYHHYEQADTLAIQKHIDGRMQAWQQRTDSSWRQRMEEYSASWFSHDDEKEKVTESILTWTDSLGREMRQEQRTTERSLSRMQQQTEQRLISEFEQRMSAAMDSVNGIWQERFNSLQTHYEQSDSSNNSTITASATGDNRPWYKRWWQTIEGIIIGAVIAALLYLTRNLWLKLFKR